MKNLKEFELKNLNQITGGSKIRVTFSGLYDGVKHNEDVIISFEHNSEIH